MLEDRSELAALIVEKDWTTTPLDGRASWPGSLSTLVSLMLASAQPMFLVWGASQVLLYNDSYAQILADKHPGALGRPFLDVWDEIRGDLDPIVDAAYTGQPVLMDDIKLMMRRKGYSEETHFSFSYTPFFDPAGHVQGFLGVCSEITGKVAADRERKLFEQALLRLNDSLEYQVSQRTDELNRLWNTSPDLLLVIDFDGMFVRVNPAWTRLLGYTPEELINHHVNEFVVPDDHMATQQAYLHAAQGGSPRLVNCYRHKDGSHRWISWVAAPAEELIFATGRDITAEKLQADALSRAEESLRQSQKLEAIGQLTGGVAHDFNNLLTVIKSSTDMLRRPDVPEARRQRYISAISTTVDRASKLTAQLLAFARRQTLKPEVFAACDSVRGLSTMMETLTGSLIRITTALPERRCYVEADPSQFDTALVNMALNARDAMQGEGQLTISVATVEAIPDADALGKGPFVAVSVADTGIGIAASKFAQIFEPFFTTKSVGHGTGLGLSQVFGFAKQSGGEVMVESEVGVGSVFTLYLPEVSAPAGESARVTEEATPLVEGHGTRVLVVEDNADVGSFAVQSLTDLGYVPLLASNGEQALAELELNADRFDVVFSDVVMPGMNGIDLARTVQERFRHLPVLLASGYSHVLAQNGTNGFELLQKPYSVDQLARLLGKVIARHTRQRTACDPMENA